MISKDTHKIIFPIFALLLLLTACAETRTRDANESYYQWSGKKPDSTVKIINGDYHQTGSLFKEYTLFMELEADSDWRNNFVRINELAPYDDDEWSTPSEAPAWFKPASTFKVWKQRQPFAESMYFEDTTSGKMFIYEIE